MNYQLQLNQAKLWLRMNRTVTSSGGLPTLKSSCDITPPCNWKFLTISLSLIDRSFDLSRRRDSTWPVWPDLAKFRHFGKVFSKFLRVYYLFGKILSLLWQNCDIIGLIFIVANGQILKKNLNIWSYCTRQRLMVFQDLDHSFRSSSQTCSKLFDHPFGRNRLRPFNGSLF